MAKTYRVRRTSGSRTGGAGRNGNGNGGNGSSGSSGRATKGRSRKNAAKAVRRWPWAVLLVIGMLLIIAIGMSGYSPEGGSLVTTISATIARFVSSIAGALSMFFCFLIILNSVVKLARPGEPLFRFVWGLWVLLVFTCGIYHRLRVPWEYVFEVARMGGGGGYVGASVWWFLRIATGRFISLPMMVLGVTVGLSLLLNKSPWTPFTLIWMVFMTGWQWFKGLVSQFFAERGPDPDEIWVDEEEHGDKDPDDEDISLRDLVDADGVPRKGSFSSAVAELQARLGGDSGGDTAPNVTGAGGSPVSAAGDPGAGLPATGSARTPQPASSDTYADEFSASVVQQPLGEEAFYEIPPLDILQKSDPGRRPKSSQNFEGLGRVIERTLMSFGIAAKVVGIEQGPAVTRFELQPGPGVKVASIVNLSQDLALALAAQDVRIEAPIPGKSAIGIEVPNKEVSLVHLRDVLETREFRNSKSPLTIALGKDISGRPVVTNLDHCLHLLIAGATGAGKSVCINSIIASLLFKSRPDQVKLVLIDPKRVELSVWSKVPHLIAPVVSDPKKAAGALRWAIKEMEARYEKFTKVGTRDIDRYNQIATPPDSMKPAMPYIVIIIDELSDLMMVAPAEVEDAIFRLAQMARASGIYLVVATQRPSVDVITGTIKANIPSRIAFAVASQIDSRTILDMAGAEKLLGRGDMLFYPVGASKPLRNQGCYISEREIDELVSFVSAQAKPQFAPGVLQVPETLEKESEISDDPFFPQALRIVVEAKQASVSLLQRKLPIGYSRAARLIDAMEGKGYVGPYEGSKPREVRLSMAEYLRMFESGESGSQAAATASSPQAGTPPPSDTTTVLSTSAPAAQSDTSRGIMRSDAVQPGEISQQESSWSYLETGALPAEGTGSRSQEMPAGHPQDRPFAKRPSFIDELRARGNERPFSRNAFDREGRARDREIKRERAEEARRNPYERY